MAKKWNDLKSQYKEQSQFWIKIPKDQELFTEKNKKNNFKDIKENETWSFLFKQFDKGQVMNLIVNQSEDQKENIKNNLNAFTDNIVNWKNVTEHDFFKNGNNTEEDTIEFDVEALDEFISKNFWVVFPIVQEINEKLLEDNKKLKAQKKT